jgi:probable phosphoglycerate mutase
MSTRLIVIRHGESNVTVRRVIGGFRTCDGLSMLGVEQAQRLARRLHESGEISADVVLASNFRRAIDTAEVILPSLGTVELQIEAAFGEHDPGPELDGMSFVDYVNRFGSPDWFGDPHVEVFPGGETVAEFHARVAAATSGLLERHAGATIVIVCHGGVIDAVFHHLLGLSVTDRVEVQASNTSITEFVQSTIPSRAEQWRLVRFNDSAHLAGLPVATNVGAAINGS